MVAADFQTAQPAIMLCARLLFASVLAWARSRPSLVFSESGALLARKSFKMRSWFYAALVLAVAGWLALFLSSSAILVWGQTVESRQAESQPYLRCWYFTGTGIFERSYWHATSGTFGKAACPRLVSL
jgi:hypothetical protein